MPIRKRVKPISISNLGPRKRPSKNNDKAPYLTQNKTDNKSSTPHKKIDDKFIKISESESIEKFKEMGEMVGKKQVRWSHYSSGYHYYKKI